MSHETVGSERQHVYVLPSLPSDMLRTSQFTDFFTEYRGPAIVVRTGDGWRWSTAPGRTAAALTVTFTSRKLLDAVIADPTDSTLARAFVSGELRMEGDILLILSISSYVFQRCGRLVGRIPYQIARALTLPQRLRPSRRKTVHEELFAQPEELSPEFFKGWLGPTLAPTCARWTSARETSQDHMLFDQAQASELSAICNALALESGDRLLDLECEWGALLLHAASEGAGEARGLARNEAQAAFVRERIAQAGFERRCTADLRPTRLPFRPGSFAKAADVSIFQHTSHSALPRQLVTVSRLLESDGLFLLQRITGSSRAEGIGSYLVNGHTFPGTDIGTLPEELAMAELAGFDILRVEDIRVEYERTLRLWIGRFEGSSAALIRCASGRSYRKWLLYLTEAAAAFYSRELSVHRILLRRARPATRKAFMQ